MSRPGPRAAQARGGFTLLELLLSLALTGAVMAMSLPFLHLAKRLWERAEREREARRALDGAVAWIARDLRQAGYHVPGPALRSIGGSGLSYTLSRDGEDAGGHPASGRRLVTVFAEGGDLKCRVQAARLPPATGWERGSTQVLAPQIESLRCRGVDAAGADTEEAAAVSLVSCTATAAGGEERTFLVRLRAPRGAGS